MKYLIVFFLLVSQCGFASNLFHGEDGYRLWLKYDAIQQSELLKSYTELLGNYHVYGDSDTMQVAREELQFALGNMINRSRHVGADEATLLVASGENATQLAERYSVNIGRAEGEGNKNSGAG